MESVGLGIRGSLGVWVQYSQEVTCLLEYFVFSRSRASDTNFVYLLENSTWPMSVPVRENMGLSSCILTRFRDFSIVL